MKDHFIDINLEYDIGSLVALYDETSLVSQGPFVHVGTDITVSETVVELFDKFNLPLNNNNCSLTTIRRAVDIHTNPGNNGLIIFPLLGDLEVGFYSAEAPIVNGLTMLSPYLKDRPPISAESIKTILNSKFATKTITKPIAINGRKIYSYRPVNGTIPLVFLIKIPFGVEWDQLQQIIGDQHA
jgi:hypothetical protein